MSVIEVNDRNFIPEVQCSEVPVLLDFFGTWCVPCQRFAPTVEELAAESEGRYKVCKVDVNAAPGLVQQFRIMSVPTVLIGSISCRDCSPSSSLPRRRYPFPLKMRG